MFVCVLIFFFSKIFYNKITYIFVCLQVICINCVITNKKKKIKILSFDFVNFVCFFNVQFKKFPTRNIQYKIQRINISSSFFFI